MSRELPEDRAGEKGVQEWLSFYFKSPQIADAALPARSAVSAAPHSQLSRSPIPDVNWSTS